MLHSLNCGCLVGIIKWLLGDRSGRWTSFLIRETLEGATSYQQAKHQFTDATLLAPGYFILGGTKPHDVSLFFLIVVARCHSSGWFGIMVTASYQQSSSTSRSAVSAVIDDHLRRVYHPGIYSGPLSLPVPPWLSAICTSW